MGTDEDIYAVCDKNLRVKGVRGLRIFDASSFPNLVAGNTNAPVIAFAGGRTCEKIIIKAMNSEAVISEELSKTIPPPTKSITETVTIPKNSLTGFDNSNLLYIE